jgi:hypothetical protein
MTTADRYLLGRVSRYHVLIPTQAILRISQADAAAADHSRAGEVIDLRVLLGGAGDEPGVAIALDMRDTAAVLVVDTVGDMMTIAPAEFFALPRIFGLARGLFDAACRRTVEGAHPLRLRRQLRVSGDPGMAEPL